MTFKFIPFPIITTERLHLRKTTLEDTKVTHFLRSDKEVNKYIDRPIPTTLKDAEDFIQRITLESEIGKSINWSICLKENGQMVGSICLWNFSSDSKIGEVGYALDTKYHNQGIMSEALKAIIDFGFNELALEEIEAYTHRNNESSKRLLTKNQFKLVESKNDKDNLDNVIFSLKSINNQ